MLRVSQLHGFNKLKGGDPYWGQVVLLMHMEGTNGASVFTDSSSRAASTTTNTAITSTTEKKFGSTSGYFSGTTEVNFDNSFSYLACVDTTIEFFAYFTSLPTPGNYFYFMSAIDGLNNGVFSVSSSGRVVFTTSGNAVVGDVVINTWYHIAATRSGTVTQGFLNGVKVFGSNTESGVVSGCGGIRIGRGLLATTSTWFNGYIDEVRITKAVRYTANFTPPTAPFPNS